jgi:hypothetical protein
MPRHPYQSLPASSFWRRSIADISYELVDPVVKAKFKIGTHDRVATAGSCFAQHIARHLRSSGFNYFVTETANPIVPANVAEKYGYGAFTARYGNIYTSRQLVQTLHRAYGLFSPLDDAWCRADGRFFDPYRPQIQPDGFASSAEYQSDRHQHFAAIRQAIERLDVFVFTLGLTEAWVSRVDGAVYPICPGVAAGDFDETKHVLVNLSVRDVIDDLNAAIEFILAKNAQARFLLTVSPVPLVATAEPRSVLVSTTYSKSVLRVAAEEVSQACNTVAYFPSYEIITGNYTRGRYFADDLRSVTEEGVSHVMRLFMEHYASVDPGADSGGEVRARSDDRMLQELAQVISVICDEEVLDRDG